MAERQQRYTDFKDPFDLLTDLHSTRLRMVYQNEFARGDRSDIEMGTRAYPNSGVGRMSSPNYNLGVQAPSSSWEARQGSGRVLPPAVQMNYTRNYGNDTVDEGTRERIGSLLGPLTDIGTRYKSNVSKARRRQELKRIEGEKERARQADLQAQADQDAREAPMRERLAQLGEEEAQTVEQMENVRLRMNVAEGLLERRNAQRQAQGQQVQAQNREAFNTSVIPNMPAAASTVLPQGSPVGMLQNPTPGSQERLREGMSFETATVQRQLGQSLTKPLAEYRQAQAQKAGRSTMQGIAGQIPTTVTSVLPKSGLGAYGLLDERASKAVAEGLKNIFEDTPPASPQSGGLAPIDIDWSKSNIPPGQVSPASPVDKSKNTGVLGGTPTVTIPPHLANRADNARKKARGQNPPPPPGYNPSTAPTQPGAPPMHRRRRS